MKICWRAASREGAWAAGSSRVPSAGRCARLGERVTVTLSAKSVNLAKHHGHEEQIRFCLSPVIRSYPPLPLLCSIICLTKT